jgi:hypothetical protein
MIKIHSHHRKPVDTSFHKHCRNVIRNEFYYYQPKSEAKGYVNHAHNVSVRIVDINDDMRGLYSRFLKSIGEEINDRTLYLLSLLQKVGEDKIKETLQYNNYLCSRMQELTLRHLGDNYSSIYNNSASEAMFRDCLGLSVFIAQAIIFAFNTFKSLWVGVKNS